MNMFVVSGPRPGQRFSKGEAPNRHRSKGGAQASAQLHPHLKDGSVSKMKVLGFGAAEGFRSLGFLQPQVC